MEMTVKNRKMIAVYQLFPERSGGMDGEEVWE